MTPDAYEQMFTIADKGIGIAAEKLENIFKRFTRANAYTGGFGVGLNFVESICNEYGITADVCSQENRGTTFTLTLNKRQGY